MERHWHVSVKDLRTVFIAICRETSTHSLSVRILSHNMTVVHCMNRQGTSRSSALLKVSENLLLAHRQQHTWQALRTSGRKPCFAKHLRRWSGISSRPSLLIRRFGVPQIDLFLQERMLRSSTSFVSLRHGREASTHLRRIGGNDVKSTSSFLFIQLSC